MATEEYVTGSTEVRLAHGMAIATSLIALVISSIGVLNTMIMSVLERTQEIRRVAGNWVAQIAGPAHDSRESALLSAAGGCLGMMVAWPCMMLVEPSAQHSKDSSARNCRSVLSDRGLLLTSEFWQSLGGLYPAYRGMRVAPSEALRYE